MQVRQTQPAALLPGLKSGASYAKGLWLRLNGSPVEAGSPASAILATLPRPMQPDRDQRSARILQYSQSIDALEKRLQDTSKVLTCLPSAATWHERGCGTGTAG